MQTGGGCDSRSRGGEPCLCLRYASLHCTWSLSHTHALRSPSPLSPEKSCLFRSQTALPCQMLSPLVFHLPPPSLTVLIYSKGCHPNEPSHTSYHSSPQAVTPQLPSLSTYASKNASSVSSKEMKLKSWESWWNGRKVALGSRRPGLSFPRSL